MFMVLCVVKIILIKYYMNIEDCFLNMYKKKTIIQGTVMYPQLV